MHRFFLQFRSMDTFPEEEPILFLAGTVKPFRVLHQRWRV
jgi:hypothetical protein